VSVFAEIVSVLMSAPLEIPCSRPKPPSERPDRIDSFRCRVYQAA
jgi:hypothetical protein